MYPLDTLLHRLESAGFRISPADRLRVVQLLDTMGKECLDNPHKLRLLLAPILARSAAEQAKFYQVFDQWMPESEAKSPPDYKRKKRILKFGLVAIILIVFCTICIWYFWPKPQVELTEAQFLDAIQKKPSEELIRQYIQKYPGGSSLIEEEILKPQLPIKQLQLAKEQEIPRPSWLAWSILALLSLAASGMWWKWARRKAPKPPEKEPPRLPGPAQHALGEVSDAPPYTIPFRGQEAYIRTGREQYRLADAMRQRQQGEHPYMDVPSSIQATLDKGGFPTLRFRLRHQPADYLCIIDEKHRQSHLTRLFRFFAEHIRGQDVALEVFQASNTLDRFWNAQYPAGLTLDQLQRLYPAHRLLVFGDAHALLDVAASGQARIRPEASSAFRRWRQRVLFTPNAPATWTFEEKALYDLFALFPATLQGMNDAAHHIEASVGSAADDEAPPGFARWRERAQQYDQDAHDHRYTRWRDATEHEEYLADRPDLQLWLRALAIYPTPTWEITLAIGQSLEKQGVVVHPDDLLILSRIGWLQTGRMPADLREDLLADLPAAAETAARHAVIAALEAARAETSGGFAGTELGVNVAVQEFALAPEDPEKQELMRLLFEAGKVNKAQEQVADGALARHVARSKSPDVFKTSEGSTSTRDFVQKVGEEKPELVPPKKPVFTKHLWLAITLSLLAIGFAMLMYLFWFSKSWFPQEKEKRDWVAQQLFQWEVLPDSATVWNNRGVQVWNESRDTVEAMRLFKAAFFTDSARVRQISDTTGAPPGAWQGYFNAQTLRYNLSAEALNGYFEAVNLPPTELRNFERFNLSLRKAGGESIKKDRLGRLVYPFDSRLKMGQAEAQLYKDVFGPNFQKDLLNMASTRLGRLEENAVLGDVHATPITGLSNDAFHAEGLIYLYLMRRDLAQTVYEQIIQRDSAYFINLHSERPNLETLLGKISDRILSVEASPDANGRLRGTVFYQLKDLPVRPPVLIAELFDKNGKVLARTSIPQPASTKGLNQVTFLLPPALNAAAFVADSLRITLRYPWQMEKALAEWKEARRFEWKDPGDAVLARLEQDMVYIPSGLFYNKNLDCADTLKIAAFRIGKFEVTQVQWRTIMGNNPSFNKGCDNCPVENVSWNAAQLFIETLNQRTGKVYRLPYEVEWEWASRGGAVSQNFIYSGSNDPQSVAWFGIIQEKTHEVGTKRPNELSLFDMSGNVWEWCLDQYPPYSNCKASISAKKILRGGSWVDNRGGVTISSRRQEKPDNQNNKSGFRIVEQISIISGNRGPCPPMCKDEESIDNKLDSDGDGTPNAQDKCPNEKGDLANGGCPLPDTDADGVPDAEDKCPNEKGERSNNGCPVPIGPDPKILAQIENNMVYIPGGTFTMGSKDKEAGDDECRHQVTVTSFSLSKYELTQAQWRAVMGSDPPELYNKGCDECPVEGVNWNDAQEFLKRLNELTGKNYRLPYEAEREYAAKGGQAGVKFSYKYAGSDNLDEVAWYNRNYDAGNIYGERKTTRPVGSKKANQLGLYDMSGNVWEWCEDTFKPYTCDKKTVGYESVRVIRGGSWGDNPENCRVADRYGYYPDSRDYYVGFRVVRGY